MASLRRTVTNISWDVGINLEDELTSLTALAASDGLLISASRTGETLSWGIDPEPAQTGTKDFTSSIFAGGAITIARTIQDDVPSPLFFINTVNGEAAPGDFGGAILNFDLTLESEELGLASQTFPMRVKFTWTDTGTGPGDTSAPDRLTAELFTIADLGPVTVDQIGFNDAQLSEFLLEEDGGEDPVGLYITFLTEPSGNAVPLAANDEAMVDQGGSVTIDVLANDTDGDGDTLSILSVDAPGSAAASVRIAGGQIVYEAGATPVGFDSFTYELSDGRGGTDTATVTVQIGEIVFENQDPIARDDERTVAFGETVIIDVLTNDDDPDGDALTLSRVTLPAGTAEVVDGAFRYTPPSPAVLALSGGSDEFEYAIEDGRGGEARATVSIRVGADLTLPDGPDPRLVTDEVGAAVSDWMQGDTILLGQPIANEGADDPDIATAFGGLDNFGSIVGFGLVALDDSSGTEPVEDLSPFLIPQGSDADRADFDLPGGTSGTLDYLLVVNDDLLAEIPPGQYSLVPVIDPGDLIAEFDEDNNALAASDVPVIELGGLCVEIPAGALAERFTGTAVSDIFKSAGGPQGNTLEGAADRDTARYVVARDAVEDVSDGGVVTITNRDSGLSDTLLSVERVELTDGTYLFDLPGTDVPFTYRLYSAAFARTPDEGGLRFWNDQRNDGLRDKAMARAFIQSPEFAEKFGSDPTDEEYVAALYRNVLEREPDPGGSAFWVTAFASGTLDRADMLLAFSDGRENLERNEENYDDGVWVS